MKKVNYRSNIIGLVKLMTSTKFSDPQLDCLKETPFWQLFDVLRIGKVDLNKCMKFNDVIACMLETYKASKDTFYIDFLTSCSLSLSVMAKLPAEQQHPVEALGWAAKDTSGILSPFKFSRRATGEKDVTFKVLYCGMCHSNLHTIKNEWGSTNYPSLPGHEIVGVVTEVGSKVQKFKVGDKVGVGCVVGSCHSCDNCANDLENYCPKMLLTYNSIYYDGTPTYGGYSNIMVADEHFVIHIPDSLPLDACAPLLCAGITTYSPLKHFGLDQPGMHVSVVGLGGLGHAAIKFAKAFGVKLVMGTMDGIIDMVSAPHPLLPLIGLLKSHGKLILVGAPEKPLELPVFPLLMGRKIVAGSCIGGMKETQEMIDFVAKHNITADIEVIPMDYVNTAMERLVKADVRYRFVIDIGNTLKIA
ncbi:hypothetical protein ACSBR2_024456 [Camellia fascicularis]